MTEMVKVLHIVSSLSKSSGVMSVIMNYYRNINRQNVQFDFLCWINDEGSYADEIYGLGGNVYLLSKPNLIKDFWLSFNNFFREHSNNYKIIHLHELYLNSLIHKLSRKYGTHYIIAHAHTTRYSDKLINSFRNRFLCIPLKKNANAYFACSQDAGRLYFGKKYLNSGKVEVINNAIDYSKFTYDKAIRNKIRNDMGTQDKVVFGHIGRFNAQKNHEFLIEVFNEIQKIKHNSVLLLVGDGPLERKIKNKVSQLKLSDKVIFLGRRDDISNILQGIDIFLLPSKFEGLGIVLVESQASGVMTFASDVVPKDVKVTNKIEFISLKSNAKEWAEIIVLNEEYKNRSDESVNIKKSSFNIKTEVLKLEKLYCDI